MFQEYHQVNFCKFFCCYNKKQQTLKISYTCKFVVFCCRNKKMLSKCCPTTQKIFWSDSFSQKSDLELICAHNEYRHLGGSTSVRNCVYASYMKIFLKCDRKTLKKVTDSFYLLLRTKQKKLSVQNILYDVEKKICNFFFVATAKNNKNNN